MCLAQVDIPQVLYEIRCFHAQQAVEKALKAVLIASNIEITKTH
ncbi:HEPN domain-containing protein [bacterium]|nr:HEPN domain-containing protein [bacterium]